MFVVFAAKNICPSIELPLKVVKLLLFTYYSNSIIKMLYLIGLGLSDETDVTVKGLQIIKKAARVYLENYTAVLLCDVEKLVGLSAIKASLDIGI